MDTLKLDKITLKKFGLTMGVAFLFFTGLFLFRHKSAVAGYSLAIASVFFISGFIFPILLKPLYIIWMRFAFMLSWINTRIILIILFYLVFTPVGLFMRILKADLLENTKKGATYWKNKEKTDLNILNYERRF